MTSTQLASTHLPSSRIWDTQFKLVDLLENGAENDASADVNEIPISASLMAKLSLLPSPIMPTF